MQITETDKGFEIKFQFNEKKLAAVKSIQGRYFRGADKTWVVPKYREREIEMLKKEFGIMLDPLFDLPEQVGAIPKLPNLDVEVQLARPLFPFQTNGVAYNRLFKRTIIGDDPGLGKSQQAIATVMSYGVDLDNMLNAGPGLIICPNTLCLNWQEEWRLVAGRRAVVLTDKIVNDWQRSYRAKYVDVFIISYDALKKFFVYGHWKKPKKGELDKNGKQKKLNTKDIPFKESIDLFKWIIVDESHYCKEGDTLRTKFVIGLSKKKEMVMELTGTPVVNKPHDLIAQLVIINKLKDIVSHLPQPRDENGKLTDWTGIDRFTMRYCSKDEKGNYFNQKELNYRLSKYCFYRREKAEVLTDLPEKTRQIVLCEITNRAEYRKAHSDLEGYLKSHLNYSQKEADKSLKAEVLMRIGILKQISARGKMEAAKEAIDEVIDAGQKIVVFCNLKEIVQEVKNMYPDAVSVVGSDSVEIRQANIQAFQNNPKVNIIVCNIKTGGVGITLTASSEVLFIEFPWHDANCKQCEDRCIAKGQLIMTKEGFRKIEEVKVGDFVYSASGLWRRVTDKFSHLERKKCFIEIKYKGFGIPLKVTEDHRVFVYDKTGEFKYVEAKDIHPLKHMLVFATPYPDVSIINKNVIDIEFPFGNDFKHRNGTQMKNARKKNPLGRIELTTTLMHALGWYLAEGWSSVSKKREKGSCVAICGNAKTETAKVLKMGNDLLNGFGLKESKLTIHKSKNNCISAYIYSKNLAHNMIKFFGHTAKEKHIPDFVFSCDNDLIESFLAGYYAGDGYKRKNTQQASTKSDKIAIGLCQLEALLGKPITLHPTAWKGWSFEYSIPGKSNRDSIIKNEYNCVLFPIEEIKISRPKRGDERVYDLTVEHDNSFTVGLAAVHNCHRIGQKGSVRARYLLGDNTIDRWCYDLIQKKKSIATAITGDEYEISEEVVDDLFNLFNQV